MSSDFNYNFGFVVEEIFELGITLHTAGLKYRSQVTGQVTGHRSQVTGHRTGHRSQVTGHNEKYL